MTQQKLGISHLQHDDFFLILSKNPANLALFIIYVNKHYEYCSQNFYWVIIIYYSIVLLLKLNPPRLFSCEYLQKIYQIMNCTFHAPIPIRRINIDAILLDPNFIDDIWEKSFNKKTGKLKEVPYYNVNDEIVTRKQVADNDVLEISETEMVDIHKVVILEPVNEPSPNSVANHPQFQQ